MKMTLTLALSLLLLCATVPCRDSMKATAQARQKRREKSRTHYSCPMHPEVVSARPGKCPKCGMALRISPDESETAAAPSDNPAAPAVEPTGSLSSLHIPNTPVYDQDGKRLNFYTDLVKGKTVAINFIFTTCTTICPPLTATFRRVQQELGERIGRDVRLISVSVDPETDVPERLHDFALKFRAGPGWTFVTGNKFEIDALLQALGTAVVNKNDHTPMVLIGNDSAGYWTRTYGLSSPATLVKIITETEKLK
jgi:cytochrome oxidase Cu insertion factor (SCO1/SenC/PrrC family)